MSSAAVNKMTGFFSTTLYINVELIQQVVCYIVLIYKREKRTLTSTAINEGYMRDAERAGTVSAAFLNWP